MTQWVFGPLISALLLSCIGKTSDDIAPEDDTISGAEMPAGQPLTLDSLHNVRVIEHGLQFDQGFFYSTDSGKQKWVPSSHQYSVDDTALFNPIINGYGVSDGKISIALTNVIIRDTDARVIYEASGSKHVSRLSEHEAPSVTQGTPIRWLDSLANSHRSLSYEAEYTIKDRITGKSVDGLYRIRVAR